MSDFRLGSKAMQLCVSALYTHADTITNDDALEDETNEEVECLFEDAQRCRSLAREISGRIPEGTPIATVTFAPSNLPLHDRELPLL